MRALLVPELYRPDTATANGTLNDLLTLAERWLARDPSLHLYWPLPPREMASYDEAYVLADRERVTLIEAEPFMAGDEREDAFSETGHSEAEFRALRRRIYDEGSYVDVVVELGPADDPVRAALDEFAGTVPLDELVAATADHTDDGRPVTADEGYARADLRYALRSLGYEDAGRPGTPEFEAAERRGRTPHGWLDA